MLSKFKEQKLFTYVYKNDEFNFNKCFENNCFNEKKARRLYRKSKTLQLGVQQQETHKIFKKIKPDFIEDDERLINKIGKCNYDKYKHIFEEEHAKLKTDDEYSGLIYENLYKYNQLCTKQLIIYCENLEKRITELEKRLNI